MKGILEKKILVKKAGNVQGSVRIHFPDPKVQDIVLTNFDTVNVFGRIGMTAELVKISNLSTLVLSGVLQIVRK